MEYTESGAVQNQSTGCKSQHNTRVRQQQSGHKPALITAHTKWEVSWDEHTENIITIYQNKKIKKNKKLIAELNV